MNIFASLFFLPVLALSQPSSKELASRSFSLENRYPDASVNTVFKDNILLTLKYINGQKFAPNKVNWDEVEKPFTYELTLKPDETFAFHDDVLPKYKGKVAKTTNAHFNYEEGYKSDGFLVGDGVCHLASFFYWIAKDAGLSAEASVRHDFRPIPDVLQEFGVSIYAYPGEQYGDQMQNLYITNNKENAVVFNFDYNGKSLTITVTEKK